MFIRLGDRDHRDLGRGLLHRNPRRWRPRPNGCCRTSTRRPRRPCTWHLHRLELIRGYEGPFVWPRAQGPELGQSTRKHPPEDLRPCRTAVGSPYRAKREFCRRHPGAAPLRPSTVVVSHRPRLRYRDPSARHVLPLGRPVRACRYRARGTRRRDVVVVARPDLLVRGRPRACPLSRRASSRRSGARDRAVADRWRLPARAPARLGQ